MFGSLSVHDMVLFERMILILILLFVDIFLLKLASYFCYPYFTVRTEFSKHWPLDQMLCIPVSQAILIELKEE